MTCDRAIRDMIENGSEYGDVLDAAYRNEYRKRLQRAVWKAKMTGKYVDPAKKVSMYKDVSHLVGKKLYVENFETNRAEFIDIESAEMVASNKISINSGEYVINIEENTTTDYQNGVQIYGSDETTAVGDEVKLIDVSGTVLQDLDDVIAKMVNLDGEALSETHKEHLMAIFDGYKAILQEAGKDVKFTAEVFKAMDSEARTYGEADVMGNKLKLVMGNSRFNTMTEILAHELQHILIAKVLSNNPELRSQVAELRDAMKGEVSYEMFLGNIKSPTKEDIDIAKKKYDYMFNGKSDEFLAYVTTNEMVLNRLNNVVKGEFQFMRPLKENAKSPKWVKIINKLIAAINKFYSGSRMQGKSGSLLALELLEKALEVGHLNAREENKSAIDKVLDKIAKADERIAGMTKKIEKEQKTYAEYLGYKDVSVADKAIDSLWKIRGLGKVRSLIMQNAIFSSVTRALDHKDVARFYEMYRHSKSFIDKNVVAVKTKTADILSEVYGLKNIDVSKRRAAKRVLVDTDAHVLGDIKVIKGYLESSKALEARFMEITEEFDSDVVNAINELARALVSNVWHSRNGFVNATQIAKEFLNTTKGEAVDKIDEAVSLLAIKYSSDENKKLTLEAINEDKGNGLEMALELLRKDKAKVLKEAYGGNKMYEVKGAKKEEFLGNKKHYIVKKAEMQELSKAKFLSLGKHDDLSAIVGEDVFVMVGESLDTSYNEGLLSTVQLKNEGDSLRRLITELTGKTEVEVEMQIAYLSRVGGKSQSALVPERDGNGNIYDYRVRMGYEDKLAYIGIEDDIVLTVAGTVSNLTHKQEAMANNRAALRYLGAFYTKHKNNKEFKFVEISKDSNGKFKEYWDILPYYVKKDIEKSMGGVLRIEEGMLVDFFGYSDASLMNAPWIKDSKKRQLIVKKFEDIVKEVVGRWKHQIVTMTPAVIRGNMLSNMIIALEHTKNKNPLVYMAKFKQVWGWMNDYQEVRSKKIGLEIRQDAEGVDYSKQIKALQIRLEENPVHVIMEDGQYTAILEDINTEYFNNKGPIEEKIDNAINGIKKEKSRVAIKAIIDTAYIRKDSRIHDSVMKLTTYSDAINKMIILMDLAEREKGKVTKDMLSYIDRLHVNYSYLDNKYVKYANDVGFLIFTKYFFRIIPAMIKMASKKSVTMFLTESTKKVTGIDAETPLDQLFNPIDSIVNKMSLWGEPSNIFSTVLTPPYIR